MSEISYTVDGHEIELEMVETLEGTGVNALDDERGNPVMLEITGKFQVVFNPEATSWKRVGQNIQKQAGELAPVSLDALLLHLSTPRGIFRWTVGGVEQLRSPVAGKNVDSKNGPIPKVLGIKESLGVKTYLIDWQITTWQALTERFSANPSPLLSHQWQQEETLTGGQGRWYSIRHTNGRCLFDTSRLPANITPDSFRLWLVPRLPNGFRRAEVTVTAVSSGAELLYRLTDIEERVTIKAVNVSHIECTHQAHLTVPGIDTVISSSITGGAASLSAAAGVARTAAAGSAAGWAGRLGTAGMVASALISIGQTIRTSMPSIVFSATARVWGTKNRTLTHLHGLALRAVQHRLSALPTVTIFGAPISNYWAWNSQFSVLHDVEAGMAEITRGYIAGIAPSAGVALVDPEVVIQTIGNAMNHPGDDIEPSIFPKSLVNSPSPATVPGSVEALGPGPGPLDLGSRVPPSQVGTRGHTLARIVAQQLEGFAERPNAPEILPVVPLPDSPHK